MAQQEDPYGLALMDVLINTLLLAMVLMMIAAVFIEPIKTENVPDPEVGSSADRTALEFKTVIDPFESGCDLNLTFQLVGGNPANVQLQIKMKNGNIPKDSINVFFGVFDRRYWHISRNCWPDLSINGEWEIILTAKGITDLPREILLHGVKGLKPLRFSERKRVPKRQLEQTLLTISGDGNSNSMPNASLP